MVLINKSPRLMAPGFVFMLLVNFASQRLRLHRRAYR